MLLSLLLACHHPAPPSPPPSPPAAPPVAASTAPPVAASTAPPAAMASKMPRLEAAPMPPVPLDASAPRVDGCVVRPDLEDEAGPPTRASVTIQGQTFCRALYQWSPGMMKIETAAVYTAVAPRADYAVEVRWHGLLPGAMDCAFSTCVAPFDPTIDLALFEATLSPATKTP